MTRDADNRTTELLCCPFCGGEAKLVKQIEGRYALARYSVSCNGCGLVAFYEATEAEAIAAWNARAERTCKNTSDSNYFRCSVCRKKTYRGEETFNYCPNCGARVVE